MLKKEEGKALYNTIQSICADIDRAEDIENGMDYHYYMLGLRDKIQIETKKLASRTLSFISSVEGQRVFMDSFEDNNTVFIEDIENPSRSELNRLTTTLTRQAVFCWMIDSVVGIGDCLLAYNEVKDFVKDLNGDDPIFKVYNTSYEQYMNKSVKIAKAEGVNVTGQKEFKDTISKGK